MSDTRGNGESSRERVLAVNLQDHPLKERVRIPPRSQITGMMVARERGFPSGQHIGGSNPSHSGWEDSRIAALEKTRSVSYIVVLPM